MERVKKKKREKRKEEKEKAGEEDARKGGQIAAALAKMGAYDRIVTATRAGNQNVYLTLRVPQLHHVSDMRATVERWVSIVRANVPPEGYEWDDASEEFVKSEALLQKEASEASVARETAEKKRLAEEKKARLKGGRPGLGLLHSDKGTFDHTAQRHLGASGLPAVRARAESAPEKPKVPYVLKKWAIELVGGHY
jgi:hypothetical protein